MSLCGRLLQMQVWDTAGQERFRTITQSYYRSAHGAMVAYDITRRATFESVSHWIREVEHYGAASVVLILIGEQKKKTISGGGFAAFSQSIRRWRLLPAGNKSDLQAQRQVLFEDACTLAESNGVLAVLETSAKEAQNVDAAFTLMARELLARNGTTVAEETLRDSPKLKLSNSSHSILGAGTSDKKCGC